MNETVPVPSAAAASQEAAVAADHLVLVAQQDELTARLIESTLQAHGLRTAWASDGDSALKLLYTLRPGVLVIDTHMPGRSGLEVLGVLRSAPYRPPVLVLSALGGGVVEDTMHAAGADDFLCKPFDPSELVGRVRQLL